MPTNHHAHRPTLGDALLALYRLSRGRRTSPQELARHLGLSPRRAEQALCGLARLGLAQADPPRLTMAGLVRAAALADEMAAAAAEPPSNHSTRDVSTAEAHPRTSAPGRAVGSAAVPARRCAAGALDGPRQGCPAPARAHHGKMPRSL